MKIEIHSIKSIEDRSTLPWPPRTSLISIGDPDAPPPKLLHKPENILRLVFDDITLDEVKEEFNLPKAALESDEKLVELLRLHNTYIFDERMARGAAEFIYKYRGETDLFLCQCHYGQSRSAGFAAAISEHFCGNGIEVFANRLYCPNKLVYREMMAALERQKRASEEELAAQIRPLIEEMHKAFIPRDPNRMDVFLSALKTEWLKAPDQRFGQLMYNFFSETGDPFYWEEDEFIEKLAAYMSKSDADCRGEVT